MDLNAYTLNRVSIVLPYLLSQFIKEDSQYLVIIHVKLKTGNDDLVIIGGGHAATLAIRATQRGLLKPSAIAAVAPTWAGPLPIVFGRDSSMATRSVAFY